MIDRAPLGISGQFCASPIAAGGHNYIVAENGSLVVLKAGDTLDLVARRDLGERVTATPAISENQLYLRTENHLLCFGAKH